MSRTLNLHDAHVVRWDRAEFVARVREAMTIYAEAMGYSPSVVDNRAGYASGHADRPGFRAVAAVDLDGVLLGFGYGYTSEPGQWWHDQVVGAVDREAGRAVAARGPGTLRTARDADPAGSGARPNDSAQAARRCAASRGAAVHSRG
ncbi:MAG: hypothetical protein WKF47_00885 [Geodermatophilaceae bacterium]